MSNYSVVLFVSFCIIFITIVNGGEHPREGGKHGTLIRQKKRIVTLKKPIRHHERVHGRQTNYQRAPISAIDEYDTFATSENPNGNWKPIPYARYVEDPSAGAKSKPTTVNTISNGDVGHIQQNNNKNSEREIPAPAPAPQQEHVSSEQFEDYALLHYYIPFDQLVTQTSKPIMETLQEMAPQQIPVEQLMKAAVEPIPVFRVQSPTATTSTTSTTAAPVTTVKTEPPTTTTVYSVPAESKTEEKENEFSGHYEYEYFVQDNHWGTNFGHKEFRDGKQTKGDYEVVLPDGRVQHVQYWSDASGYHASVTYHPLYKKFKQYKPQS